MSFDESLRPLLGRLAVKLFQGTAQRNGGNAAATFRAERRCKAGLEEVGGPKQRPHTLGLAGWVTGRRWSGDKPKVLLSLGQVLSWGEGWGGGEGLATSSLTPPASSRASSGYLQTIFP